MIRFMTVAVLALLAGGMVSGCCSGGRCPFASERQTLQKEDGLFQKEWVLQLETLNLPENTEKPLKEITMQIVTSEPQSAVYKRGTKERPSWAPTGSFSWPATGTITSRYGYRYIFGSSDFHTGLDIANSYGTNVYAADGGVVVKAGWSGSYGYLVVIDHQNGYQTYYAHNSSLLVSVGDKVYKGEHIAEMGSTGRATGNHCHFEVRYNGQTQNPLNYLP